MPCSLCIAAFDNAIGPSCYSCTAGVHHVLQRYRTREPYFLIFGNFTLGLPHLGFDVDTHDIFHETQEKLQLAFKSAGEI